MYGARETEKPRRTAKEEDTGLFADNLVLTACQQVRAVGTDVDLPPPDDEQRLGRIAFRADFISVSIEFGAERRRRNRPHFVRHTREDVPRWTPKIGH